MCPLVFCFAEDALSLPSRGKGKEPESSTRGVTEQFCTMDSSNAGRNGCNWSIGMVAGTAAAEADTFELPLNQHLGLVPHVSLSP